MPKFVPIYRVCAVDRTGQVEVKNQRVRTEEEMRKLVRRLERGGYTNIKCRRV